MDLMMTMTLLTQGAEVLVQDRPTDQQPVPAHHYSTLAAQEQAYSPALAEQLLPHSATSQELLLPVQEVVAEVEVRFFISA